ncbi:MAG TPA: glycosyltransferase [Gemmataceae bacterium]|nr:glycosyltransferase [Gemmataceae bacterium]
MDDRSGVNSQVSWPISLVIPAYNEEAGIRQAIEEADDALAALASDYEVLVVDDGSQDTTAAIVAQTAQQRPHVKLLRHQQNKGYGAALRTGFEAARCDRVAFTDADCQFHLADLASLLALTRDHEIAAGYRMDRQDPWLRKFYSWGYNRLIRGLLGTRVRDCDCALKVFRKEAVLNLLPQTPGFFVNTEMLTQARQLGYRVAEAGVRHRPRLRGVSKVSLRDIPRTLQALLPFWWSRVLFPARLAEQPGTPGRVQFPVVLQTALLVIVAALLFFARLGSPLQEPEESRYAEIPRQMLENGSLAIPYYHGLAYYDKPPLLYWLVMGAYTVFGVHDWAARLVPSGAAFLTVLLVYLWGRKAIGQRAGFLGAVMLCLSGRFIYLGRLLTMNSLLCLFVVASAAAAYLALSGPRLRWRWWTASALACALGCLAKGPVALLLVAIPILAYQALDARANKTRLLPWLAYMSVAIAFVIPWFARLALSEPDSLTYFFWKQNLIRYVAPFDHVKPVWFYLPEILLGMLPWSLLIIPFARFLGRREGLESQRRPAGLGFVLLAAFWCLVFFSLSGSKRPGYILPAMPFLAVALGAYLDTVLTCVPMHGFNLAGYYRRFARYVNVLIPLLCIAVVFVAAADGLLRAGMALGLIGVALGLLVAPLALWRSRNPGSPWTWCGVMTFISLFAAVHLLLPGYARRFSMRGQVRPIAELSRDLRIPVVSYPRRWDSVSFYLERDDVRVYTAGQQPQLIADLRANREALAFVKSEHYLNEFLRALPRSLQFVPLGRQGQVTMGWVQARKETLLDLFAARTAP